MGPRATSAFLVVTAIVFAVFLGALAWRNTAGGGAPWVLALGLTVAAAAIGLAVVFARGVGEGRL